AEEHHGDRGKERGPPPGWLRWRGFLSLGAPLLGIAVASLLGLPDRAVSLCLVRSLHRFGPGARACALYFLPEHLQVVLEVAPGSQQQGLAVGQLPQRFRELGLHGGTSAGRERRYDQ